ncbi:MAG: NAD(P)-binding protein, partial [Cyanobacteria bacterium P01_H01_bin.121]
MSHNPASPNTYDLILIGSGMGALTVASLMAQLRHQRVLILERHFKVGGFTHSFKRRGFQWDSGVHYIGDLHDGSRVRQLFDLVTQQHVRWHKMPEPLEKFVYAGKAFNFYGDVERLQKELLDQFP